MQSGFLDGSRASNTRECEFPGCGVTQGLKRCSRCSVAWYCSTAHQADDWKQHRKACRPPPPPPAPLPPFGRPFSAPADSAVATDDNDDDRPRWCDLPSDADADADAGDGNDGRVVSLDTLPLDCLARIFERLPPLERVRAHLVSRRLARALARPSSVWARLHGLGGYDIHAKDPGGAVRRFLLRAAPALREVSILYHGDLYIQQLLAAAAASPNGMPSLQSLDCSHPFTDARDSLWVLAGKARGLRRLRLACDGLSAASGRGRRPAYAELPAALARLKALECLELSVGEQEAEAWVELPLPSELNGLTRLVAHRWAPPATTLSALTALRELEWRVMAGANGPPGTWQLPRTLGGEASPLTRLALAVHIKDGDGDWFETTMHDRYPRLLPEGLDQLPALDELQLHLEIGILRTPGARLDDLARLTRLTALELNAAGLSEVPPAVLKLTGLQHLSFFCNAITKLPKGMTALVKLRTLDLRHQMHASNRPLAVAPAMLKAATAPGAALQSVAVGLFRDPQDPQFMVSVTMKDGGGGMAVWGEDPGELLTNPGSSKDLADQLERFTEIVRFWTSERAEEAMAARREGMLLEQGCS